MPETFKHSFKLKNTYRANGIIYSLKSIPLIRKLIPSTLYASSGLKTFANVVSILLEIFSMFTGKFIYLFMMVYFPAEYLMLDKAAVFPQTFCILTIIGGLIYTNIFTPAKHKYYALFIMRMNADDYAKAATTYYLIKNFIGCMIATVIVGHFIMGSSLVLCLVLPVFLIAVKAVMFLVVLVLEKKSITKEKEMKSTIYLMVIAAALLAIAYLLAYQGMLIPDIVVFAVTGVFVIAAVPSLKYLYTYKEYKSIYRKVLCNDSYFGVAFGGQKATSQSMYLKKLDATPIDIGTEGSGKLGYKFFNDVFVKRHRRLLMKSAKRVAIITAILLAAAVASIFISNDISKVINEGMLTSLPYFLFIMYLINSGKNITQAMFMNCDHSMLAYRFYRQPKSILSLFRLRLKSIIIINLIPTLVIACGLPLLLLLSGGTESVLNYAVLFVSIVAMSVFFSVHHLVMYYLFQPYNIELEVKNPVYSIISSITYVFSYLFISIKVPTLLFGSLISAFCIIYILIALLLAFKLAPRTFKLRN